MRSHLSSGVLRRLLYLSVPIVITVAALLGIGALLTVRAAPPPAPLAQSSDALLRVTGDDTADDFLEGSFYRTGVARRSPANGGDDDGDVSLLSVGIAGQWAVDSDTALPNINSHTAEIYQDQSGNEHVYVIGGRYGGQTTNETGIYSATVLPGAGVDGADILSEWQKIADLPSGRSRHESVIVNDYLYVIGGETPFLTEDSNITESVLYAPLNPLTGEIGQFNQTGMLLEALEGDPNNPQQPPNCRDAPFSTEDGRAQMGVTVVSDTIFVIGGQPDFLDETDCVFYATPVSTTGEISSWKLASQRYPDHVLGNTATANNGVIYSASGGDAQVYSGRPLTDTGPVHNWNLEPSLPEPRRHATAIQYNGQLLLLGGTAGGLSTDPFATAYANFLDRNGNIDGGWLTTSPLQAAVFRHDTVVSSRGWVYVIGGISGSGGGASTDDIIYGTLAGDSSQYTEYGEFTSDELVLDPTNELKELRWTVSAEDHTAVSVTVDYRMAGSSAQLKNAAWQTTTPTLTMNGVQTPTHTFPDNTKTTYFQYRVRMGTTQDDMTPVVQKVDLVYEVLPPDLSVDKQTEVGPVGRGDLLTYTIEYQHIGQAGGADEIADVALTETFPAYLDLVSSDMPFSFVDIISETDTAIDNESNQPFSVTRRYKRYRADLGTVARNDQGSIQLVTQVTDTLEGLPLNERGPAIENEVEIGYPGPDQNPGNNVDAVSNDLALPDLDLVKDRYPKVGDVSPGQTIYYTLTLVNDSNYTATNVIVTDKVPTNTTFVSAGQGGVLDTSTQPRPTVRWGPLTMTPNAAQNLTLRVRVNTDVEFLQQVRNIAEVVSEDTLPEESNAVVNTVKTNPQLEISKHVSSPVAGPGDTLTYEVRYTNTGDVDLTSVVFTDTVPELLSYETGTASNGGTYDSATRKIIWNVGRIKLGAKGTLRFQATITRPLPAGTQAITNVARAKTQTIVPFNSAPSVVTIDASPNLKITKHATPRYDILPGDLVTFTLAYTNVGEIGVADYVITDRLPANTSLVSASDGGTLNNGVVEWTPAAELAGLGGSFTRTLVVRANSFGSGTNGIANVEYGITANAYGMTEMGDPVYVPGGPDLAATRIAANQTVFRPQDSGAMTIYVDVTNRGGQFDDPSNKADANGIWIDLYITETASPPSGPGALSNVDTYWYVTDGDIADGTVVRLKSRNGDHLTGEPYPDSQLSVGTYYAYAQANTDDGTPLFPVEEWPRANNIIGPLVFTVTNTVTNPPPHITSVSPNPDKTEFNTSLDISGSNFRSGATVWLERDGQRRYGNVSSVRSDQITASFDMQGQLTGYWDVIVVNPDGGQGMLPDGVWFIRPTDGPPPPVCPPDCNVYVPLIRQD